MLSKISEVIMILLVEIYLCKEKKNEIIYILLFFLGTIKELGKHYFCLFIKNMSI